MKQVQQPKKNPEFIRGRIIEQAIMLASEKGTSGISIQGVANGAGITKGGVFHHFANKHILIEEMVKEIINHLDRKVESLIASDDSEYGKFTRAYVHAAFMSEMEGLTLPWTALTMTMITDTTFNAIFGKWLKGKLERYTDTDNFMELELIRLAAEGLWLQAVTEIINKDDCMKYKNELIKRTYL